MRWLAWTTTNSHWSKKMKYWIGETMRKGGRKQFPEDLCLFLLSTQMTTSCGTINGIKLIEISSWLDESEKIASTFLHQLANFMQWKWDTLTFDTRSLWDEIDSRTRLSKLNSIKARRENEDSRAVISFHEALYRCEEANDAASFIHLCQKMRFTFSLLSSLSTTFQL